MRRLGRALCCVAFVIACAPKSSVPPSTVPPDEPVEPTASVEATAALETTAPVEPAPAIEPTPPAEPVSVAIPEPGGTTPVAEVPPAGFEPIPAKRKQGFPG